MIKRIRQARQERFRQEKQKTIDYVAKKLRDEGLTAFLDDSAQHLVLAYRMTFYTMLRDSTAARRMAKSGGRLTVPVVVSQAMVVALTRRNWGSMNSTSDMEFLRDKATVTSKLADAVSLPQKVGI